MTYLVLSDTHLTPKFNQRKYNKLVSVISSVDRVIINGDLWDGLMCDFDDFLNSKWQALFPLLKEKKAIYIYGNHDLKTFSSAEVKRFCVSNHDDLDITVEGIAYHFMHGHEIVSMGMPEPTFRHRVIEHGYQMAFMIALRVLGTERPFFLHRKWTAAMKAWKKEHIPTKTWLVTGHSHWPDYDENLRFCNTGMFHFGYAQYGLIENGKIRVVREFY